MTRIVMFIIIILTIAGCDAIAGTNDTAETVVNYMQAKVDGDRDTLSALLCAELESTLNREVQSFSTVEATLEDATCSRVGDSEVVTCSGAIVADYGGENTEFPLTSYRVVEEDGAWKWCGESG